MHSTLWWLSASKSFGILAATSARRRSNTYAVSLASRIANHELSIFEGAVFRKYERGLVEEEDTRSVCASMRGLSLVTLSSCMAVEAS